MKKIYPFKFLDAYTAADKDIFFGREDEIENLYQMLFQGDLILVYGASGTGKSSLIQCGLANKFQSHDWLPIPIRRNQNINDSISKALSEAAGEESQADDLDWFEEAGGDNVVALSPLEKLFKSVYLRHFKPIYLIFDQFEELYLLGNKTEQAQFVQTIREILRVEQPVKIIFSIREEYLGYLYEFEKAVPELLRKKIRIEPMNLDKVRQVLNGIDKNTKTNVSLKATEKKALTEAIFQKIRGEEKSLTIQLPYLQVFLDKLYRQITQDEALQTEAEFSLEELNKLGDIGNVLRDFLEEQVIRIAKKNKTEDEQIWKILSPFATLEGTKEPLSEAMLLERLSPDLHSLAKTSITAFVNARILRYSEKDELYEVSHDTLAKQIAAKRSDEEIALLEIDRLIANQLAFGRDLFTEKQLNIILPYLDKLSLNTEERQLIKDSQTAITREKLAQKQRNRAIRIGVTAFVIGLLLLSGFALLQWHNANKATKEAKAKTEEAEQNLKKFEEEEQKRITQEVEALIQAAEAYWGVEEKELARNTLKEALKLDKNNKKAIAKMEEWK